MQHISVLKEEVLKIFAPKQNEDFIDATIGLGGHAKEILKRTAPNGRLLAIDWDNRALLQAKANLAEFGDRVIFHQGNYQDLIEFAQECHLHNPKGILMDLGLGSWQLDDKTYGISFNSNGPLDLRFENKGMPASELIRHASIAEITSILKEYGDELKARTIAEQIVKTRKDHPIKTVQDLVNLIELVKPRFGKIHPATQTLQALRIAVNHEQENLTQALRTIAEHFDQSIVAVISFHSGEDRIVKNIFKTFVQYQPITVKPITPSIEEIRLNPRSRSAKLRAAVIVKGEE